MIRRVAALVAALLALVVLRAAVVQTVRIPSASMEPALLIGDVLLVSRLDYGARLPLGNVRLPGFRDPRPGDIIVFRLPGAGVDAIKRCVAVGGQTVAMRRKQLFVDGVARDEPYVAHRDPGIRPQRDDWGPYEVPEGHLFMLGDNRDLSDDSRFWGSLPGDRVLGRARLCTFSWDADRRRVRIDRILRAVR